MDAFCSEVEIPHSVVPRPSRWDWYCIADPGTIISPFAVLFVAFDPYAPAAYCVDEIYADETKDTTVGSICPRIIKKVNEFYPAIENWNFVYDPAGAWFAVDALARFDLPFRPAVKRHSQKEDGLATLNELFVLRRWFFSSRCKDAIWEFDNYYKSKDGKFIKRNDDQIDNARYFLEAAMFSVDIKDMDAKRWRGNSSNFRKKRKKRFYSPDDDSGYGGSWKERILGRYGE